MKQKYLVFTDTDKSFDEHNHKTFLLKNNTKIPCL